MLKASQILRVTPAILFTLIAVPAAAQSFRVQCPQKTNLHPAAPAPSDLNPVGGQIKCQEIAGGDGFATMGDGHQIYLFGFGPLSGKALIDQSLPGTQSARDFNHEYSDTVLANGRGPNGAATEPANIMNLGVLAAQEPAPMMAIDEDDEFFLTLSNVGMIMRPDLFEQHTVHFHGYPNASSFFDGVPDASVAINIAGSFTYYYTAPDAGTYFWHCHITPPEHLQMGMVGQLYVRPRQNRIVAKAAGTSADLYSALKAANTKAAVHNLTGNGGLNCTDILCTGQTPAPAAQPSPAVPQAKGSLYAYNDGDGSTRYDVEYPIQLMGFDPNFHYVGMTFNPEAFADMKDKYFLINGRGYPDTLKTDETISTLDSDGTSRSSQPVKSAINIPHNGRALLRISDLNVTEFHTIATVGIPMTVIANNARLLRDMGGNNLYYQTNSLTMAGGESADVILDATGVPAGTYYLYTTNLDHLSNDAENFGGMMTEILVN
jgi:FtsP/CotA-like multicopper oxidase with cupredoxin domain